MPDVTLVVQPSKPATIKSVYIPGSSGGGGGGGSSTTFIFNQGNANLTWNIHHGMNKYPSVTIIDSGGDPIFTNITYTDANNVVATFSAPVAGVAYLN